MEFSHVDEKGKAKMVDIGEKQPTQRKAVARGEILVSERCFEMIKAGESQKGPVLTVAQIAGIMAGKRTAELIPLCHSLNLSKIDVDFTLDEEKSSIIATGTVSCQQGTGVEMEALTAVSLALLTIYDMCKAVDKEMVISQVYLLEKQGGKSGHYKKMEEINEG
ncbi:MAG: cyclic pyranopterin monophosphate synthase MoaC [Eubacteriales bacterium]